MAGVLSFSSIIIPHSGENNKSVLLVGIVIPYAYSWRKWGGVPLDDRVRALELEKEHLERILGIARVQLQSAEEDDARRGALLAGARREMREEAEQLSGSLWEADNFEQLANMGQLAQPISRDEAARETLKGRIQALRNMLEAPYFARIDIVFEGEREAEPVYIGRATLKDDLTHEIYVYDWRSPVASVFYRFGTGPVHYDAPGGRINGSVTLKRQYEIRRGALQYFFDASVEVQDELLRGMLAGSASPRMKAIVETIQRDQDAVIRDTEHELLMVQGAAGSGKSSIALHRAAYLMYEGLSSPLDARDLMILSPNPVFERYIRGVLPELGEKNVRTATLERLLEQILGARVETRFMRFERLCGAGGAARRDSMAFKSSECFIELMERFCRELPHHWIDFQDVCYGGQTIATRQQLKQRAMRPDGAALGVRLRKIEMSLWDGIHQRKPRRIEKLVRYARQDSRHQLELTACARAYSILECAVISRRIRSFTRLDPLTLYRRLISDEAAIRRLGSGLALPENLPEILVRTREVLSETTLPLEDAAAVAYLKLLIEGSSRLTRIRQVVVDEAQDYDPMQYALLNRLFPRARFTVLGDVNQALDRRADRPLYGTIEHILNRRSALLVELKKSFRCTREILEFSLRFLDDPGGIEPFNRCGEAPGEHLAKSIEEMARLIAEEVSRCREKGMQSIALIAKTRREAQEWHARLEGVLEISLIDSEAAGEIQGAFVIPLQLSKGLEFDAVLVPDAGHYGEKRHLYVACTRALHRLNLYSLSEGRNDV
jgi:DNA helicase-2/ATP-dependent DNA helicase PcrA